MPESAAPTGTQPGGKRRTPATDRSDTRAARGGDAQPRLPHERDQSSDSQQQDRADERIEQAADDVAQGRVDTGRSPVTQELARKHLPAEPGDEGAGA